jgi:septal ring factor EnvC (AmiA/AmiB activator)
MSPFAAKLLKDFAIETFGDLFSEKAKKDQVKAEIANKENDIAKVEAEIVKKEKIIAKVKAEIANKENIIAKVEAEIVKKEKIIAKVKAEIDKKEMIIAKRDKALMASAKKLLLAGDTTKRIAFYTGLSIETVKKISKEIQSEKT